MHKYANVFSVGDPAIFYIGGRTEYTSNFLKYTNNSVFFCIFAPYRTFGVLLSLAISDQWDPNKTKNFDVKIAAKVQ